MPLKIRFSLEGGGPPDPYQHARGLRAVVLNWIDKVNPKLSTEIHDFDQPKPYCISPLRRENAGRRKGCFFDLSVLVDGLYAPILEGQAAQEDIFHLGNFAYRVCEREVHHLQTYEEIVEGVRPDAKEFRLRLCTPTAHHRGSEIRKAVVLPDPELYFGSWWTRWNLCSELQISEAVLAVVARQVAVSYCQGGTQTANIDEGRNFAGFVGEVTFVLLKPNTIDPEIRQALAALGRFAEYCGTGVDTMRGMGETQLLGVL